ncbi:hypothetical protein M406DRAFT_72844 [Cryphonectria parasitica EP155]|uniref:Zn(2)-C6 fungal-type domain-containing protein n=1 Tax=Cryphonectria parasitica (strain ATCC 38755 / EP155) TaxID=660469 RepID=A0A9P4XYI2_CRYP1|nr:uncharacterized protein M406DRAFT_72844 [Cryphonectria parasitica EP155]KAF3762870.1 hypothetical protein M406DRAFT_72844 [Cryphonectria parasitica EP155]
MVSRPYYPPPHPHAKNGARYPSGRSCAPYLSYSERRYQLPSHDAQVITMTDTQTEETTPPRKRIAVACGRCRKRKIRCSGDSGGGQPCDNCKNSGTEQCLFLRVRSTLLPQPGGPSNNTSCTHHDELLLLPLLGGCSRSDMVRDSQVQSQEAPMREDCRYDYNMDISRSLAQRGAAAASMAHMSTAMTQYPQDMQHLLGPATGALPAAASYRGNGYSPIGPEWADAYGSDASVDYALSCPPYPVLNNDPVHMVSSYGHWPAAAASRQRAGGHGANGVCLDSDAGYAYSAMSSNTTALAPRPAVSVPGDSSAYSFSGIAASLPSAGSERLLPTPISQTLGNGSGNNSYRGDGLLSGYGASRPGQGSTAVSGVTICQTTPVAPLSTDVTAAAVGYASSAYEYATAARSSQQHGGNPAVTYAAASSGGSETIFGPSDRSAATQGSAVDLSGYTYGAASPAVESPSMPRASSGSIHGLTSRSVAESSPSSAGYVESDSSASTPRPSGAYQHQSPSHGHTHSHVGAAAASIPHHPHHHQHHHQQHHGVSHHASPRHASRHLSQQQQQQQQQHAITSSTAYGEVSSGRSSGSSSSGLLGGPTGGTIAATDSHRVSVTSHR